MKTAEHTRVNPPRVTTIDFGGDKTILITEKMLYRIDPSSGQIINHTVADTEISFNNVSETDQFDFLKMWHAKDWPGLQAFCEKRAAKAPFGLQARVPASTLNHERKAVTLGAIFTEKELAHLMRVIGDTRKQRGNGVTVNAELVKIILPLMPRIDDALGQENDVRFIGYMVEAAYDNLLSRQAVKL